MRIVLPLILTLCFALSACGQKGDLYIPKQDQLQGTQA